MADGDLAATVAGWTKVLDSDDLRLGYQKIDQAADLALKYGQLRFANATALLAFSQAQNGQRAVDLTTGNEYRWNGTTWQLWNHGAAQVFTPTWGGLTAGNGVNASTWRMREGQAEVVISFTLGTTSSVTGVPTVNLPVNAADAASIYGQGHLYDGTRVYAIYPFLSSTAQFQFRYLSVSGTTLQYVNVGATAPFTFASGHQLLARFTYRVY